MLRIAHTESSINMGGQELLILDEMRWLLDNGHAAWLLARENSAIFKEALGRGLPLRAVPFQGSLNPRAVFKLLDFVKREKIDLINCHSSRDAGTACFARMMGIPVVRTQHICKALKDDFFHKLLWTTGSDRMIAVSDSIAGRIVNQGLGCRERIDVIGPGIDLCRFRPGIDAERVRLAFGVPTDARLVTTVGMIRPDKAQYYLIRAVDRILEKIPDAWFFVVGSPTKPRFLEQLLKEIDLIRHKERVILTGFQDKVEEFMAASDVIVLTSRIEARSLVIPQAFAMKKVVIAPDVGGIPEYVRPGETGFLYSVGDVEKLAELVVEALSSDLSTQIETAYAMAMHEMGVDTMMTAILRTYEKVLGASRQPERNA